MDSESVRIHHISSRSQRRGGVISLSDWYKLLSLNLIILAIFRIICSDYIYNEKSFKKLNLDATNPRPKPLFPLRRQYPKALRPSGKNESQIRYVSYFLDLRVASTATPRRPTTTTPVIAGRV